MTSNLSASTRASAVEIPEEDRRALRQALLAELTTQRELLAAHLAAVEDLGEDEDLLQREVGQSDARRIAESITELEQALARLDDGTYGVCEQCHEPIALERLLALPTTRRCISCSATRTRLFG